MNNYHYNYSPAIGGYIEKIKKSHPGLELAVIEELYIRAYQYITTNEDYKLELISKINHILGTYKLDMFYKLKNDGTIEFNPFSLVYNQENTETWMLRAYGNFWRDIKDTFVENGCNDITKREYIELQKTNYNSQLFERIVIKKVCNSLGIKNKELIKKININDEVPIECLINIYNKQYGIDRISKYVGYSLDSVVEEISNLGLRYGSLSTIDYVVRYIVSTINKIKQPEISKKYVIEYVKNMPCDDSEKVYFADALYNFPAIEDKDKFTKYYESKFMKEELTKQKCSLINSRNNKSNTNTRKLKKES